MKTDIMGVLFDNFTVADTVEKAIQALDSKKPFFIVTPNPEIVNIAIQNHEYRDVLNSADIVTPDGIGIVYASKIIGGEIKKRAAGFDIVKGILEKLNEKSGSVYLFGGKPSVAEIAAQKISEEFPAIKIAGFHHGYFDDDAKIINDIKSKKPDLLLVCLGAPKQEMWIYNNKDILNAGIMIGAGGSIDVLSGMTKRAPEIFIKLNLEWFYRLLNEPKRIGRMAKIPVFLLKVLFKRGLKK
ncbi:MAG: WecB/TagA/CpsF family glycosyltransferase [Clostridia bacterium]|nr:WecB/TagA/CpsF family glycosyltransferase [Clostridia bacterium]